MFKVPNSAVYWVAGGATVFLILVLYIPFLRNLFRFSSLRPDEIALCVAAGIASILWFEVLKVVRSFRKTA
jgi:Ca2+-transporting ATPase